MSALTPRRLLTALAVVLLLAAAVWWLGRPKPIPVAFAEIDRGRVESTVANTRAGTVEACLRTKLSTILGGRIEVLAVKEGDRVQKGQLLMKLWNDDQQAQSALALTQVVPDPNARAVPLIKEIQDNFQKFPPKDAIVNHTFVEGYLGAKLLTEALRRAGPNPTRKKLRDALESIRDYDVGGLHVGFSPTSHNATHFVDITILNRDGKLLR